MAESQRRVPMFFKLLAGCLFLALMLIFGGSVVVQLQTRKAGTARENYLYKHFKRYLNYQAGLGQSLWSVTGFIAQDRNLRAALANPTALAARPDSASAPASPGAIAEATWKALSRKHAIKPDLMALFDRDGKVAWSRLGDGDFEPEDPAAGQAINQVARGDDLVDKVLLYRGRAYQIVGVPMRRPDGQKVVGGIILGIALDRHFADYRDQSDKRIHMRHQLTLLHAGKVVSSVMPEKSWDSLEKKLSAPIKSWTYANDPGTYKQRMVTLDKLGGELRSGGYDVYGPDHPQDPESARLARLQGFAGPQAKGEFELYLLRSRSNLQGRGDEFPVMELVIGIAWSVIVAFVLALWITRPIKEFVRQSRQILTGETDLTQRIDIRSRDETQALAHNINKAFERLYQLASEVQNAAFQVGASSAEISAASKQMLSGLKHQTERIEGSTAAVTELSASIQQVASNAAEATKVAEKSNVAVTSAVARMQEIRGAVEEAADKMRDLGESSKRIGNIVEVIRQISEQTSLLALNASIEAAHAGEQGRGFAVVADEVSSLARRVGQSAKDIETLIQTIKEQTSAAVSSMQVGTSEVEEGTQLVTNTLSDLQNLIDVVKDTATAVQEQAVVSDEIARNMDAVQSIAVEVLSGSEESVIQAQQLHELAFVLEQSVNGFNLEGAATPPGGRSKAPGAASRPKPAGELPPGRDTGSADSAEAPPGRQW